MVQETACICGDASRVGDRNRLYCPRGDGFMGDDVSMMGEDATARIHDYRRFSMKQ